MKYITTSKHPELKAGLIISKDNSLVKSGFIMIIGNEKYIIHQYQMKTWLEKGWCKEIQEPKWTDDDMLDFAIYYKDKSYKINNVLDHWKEENNKTT